MQTSKSSKLSVLIYFVTTFVISWGAIYVVYGEEAIPATEELKEAVGTLILLGPFIASLILTLILDGIGGVKRLFSQLSQWRLKTRWYLVAIGVAPLATLISVLVVSIFIDNCIPAICASNTPTDLILLGVAGGLFIALFEEIGWTGFATTQLRGSYGVVAAGLLIGVIWGAWHFILFWEENSFNETDAFILLVARLFSWLPAYRILMVYIHDRTRSLLAIILMHLSLVASLSIFDPVLSNNELVTFILVRAAILWLMVIGLAVTGRISLRLNKPSREKS